MTTTTAFTEQAETLDELLQEHVDASGNISINATGQVVRDFDSGMQRVVAADIGAFLDSALRKKNQVNSILDSAEALVASHSIGPDRIFNNFADIFSKIKNPLPPTDFTTITPPTGRTNYVTTGTNPKHPAHFLLNEYFALQGTP